MAISDETRPDTPVPVPALDPGASYSSRLSARSALYTEFRLLMDARPAEASAADFRSLVIEENVLSRASAAARAKLWKELKARYRLDPSDRLFASFLSEWGRCASDAERGMTVYLLFALNDRLVADLGTEWLFPLLRRAPAEIRLPDVLSFVETSERRHLEVGGWSANTRRSWAQDYCASIRDFGLAKGTIRKLTVRPALYAAPVRLMVRVLRMCGVRLPDVVRSPMFRLLGMEGSEVVSALGELNRQGALRFRIQADVIELDLGEGA